MRRCRQEEDLSLHTEEGGEREHWEKREGGTLFLPSVGGKRNALSGFLSFSSR